MEGGVRYDLEVERHEDGLLVQGRLSLTLQCVCARCLEPFRHELVLPEWCSLLPWAGEDPVNVRNDCVDLTPYIREDILLAFPQHPLCEPDCVGLPVPGARGLGTKSDPGSVDAADPAWAELNKLKLEE
jgi:uncharacterized protein